MMRKSTGVVLAGTLAALGLAVAAVPAGILAATAIEYGLIAALIP